MNNAPEQYVVKRCSDTKYNGAGIQISLPTD